MELAQLISPAGPWGKVWLAAHWDRKLKKEDYLECDLRELAASFAARHSLLSLRTTGHLLLGACKIFARKCQLFEDDAAELRTRLMLVFSTMADHARGPGTAAGGGTAPPEGQLALVPEVEPELMQAPSELTLVSGKRHMARLEDITLREPRMKAEARGVPRSDDLFGALSKQDMEAALRGLGIPEVTADGDVDLGAEFDTLPLVGLDGVGPGLEASGGGAAQLGPAVEQPWMVLPPPVPDDMPAPLDMDLDEDCVLMDPLPEREPEPSPEPALPDEPMEPDVMAPYADALDGEGEPLAVVHVEAGAPKRRRGRGFFLCDEATEISKETYQQYVNNRSGITRKALLDYTVVLPHYSPNLPNFTTTFTDLCPTLCEGLLWGTEVAEKRRRLTEELENGGRAEGGADAVAAADLVARALATAAPAPTLPTPIAAEVTPMTEGAPTPLPPLPPAEAAAMVPIATGQVQGVAVVAQPSALAVPAQHAGIVPVASEAATPQGPLAAHALAAVGIEPPTPPEPLGPPPLAAPVLTSATLAPAAAVPPPLMGMDRPPLLSPLLAGQQPGTPFGLVSGEAAAAAAARAGAPLTLTERQLIANAPTTLGAVVTGTMDEEDQADNQAARVGYSGRTEKMHRFLAREFCESSAHTLSYEGICKGQGAGRRELIAGCFFELLVLKTNGVISLRQAEPRGDIQISKAKAWSK